MLDNNDLRAIAEIVDVRMAKGEDKLLGEMDRRFAESENKLLGEMDRRFAESENMLLGEMDRRFAESENMLLEEMCRDRTYLEKRIDTLRETMERMESYYRITKLEGDTSALLQRQVDELRREIEFLKSKIA